MARWVWFKDPIYPFLEFWEREIRVWDVFP